MIKTIGIIGQGFVGNSVREGFKNHYHICTFDVDSTKSTEPTMQSLVNKADILFVCLPTPMKRGGECDISIIEKVIQEINYYNKNITVLIKSTIPPGTTERFCKEYWNINIIFNPEFMKKYEFYIYDNTIMTKEDFRFEFMDNLDDPVKYLDNLVK